MTNKYDIYMKNIPSNVILIIYTFRKKRIIIYLRVPQACSTCVL